MIKMGILPTFHDVEMAAKRIKGHATQTGVLRSIELDRHTKGNIYIKPECLQLTGSFKFRGAFNRLSQIPENEKANGVVAFSSGNHGQGVALVAKLLGIPATIVMPKDAPKIKLERTQSHGAEIVLYDRIHENREELAATIASKTGAVVVPSFDDPYIVAGQGTAAYEFIHDLKDQNVSLDHYLCPAGGGGLLAGSNLAFEGLSPNTKTYSVEPEGFDDHAMSFAAGERVWVKDPTFPTSCDAIVTTAPGEVTFDINKRLVEKGLMVTEAEVREAVKFAFHYLNVVVEMGGAVALAAILSDKIDTQDQHIGIMLSGGNIDPLSFSDILVKNTT